MKIKQQKIIKNFLFSELDTEVAQKIFDEQNNILDKIILNAFNKTKNQLKTLKNTILPRIALYKALNNYGFSMEDSNNHMKNYMLNYIAKSNSNRVSCGDIVKDLAVRSSGNGGGNKSFAQGGGTDGSITSKLLENVKEIIRNL